MYRIVPFLILLFSCEIPCDSHDDCGDHSYCGGKGVCRSQCVLYTDCQQPQNINDKAICTQHGRCEIVPHETEIRIFEPSDYFQVSSDRNTIRVSGEVESIVGKVSLSIGPQPNYICSGSIPQILTLRNPTGLHSNTFPFSVDVPVSSGVNGIQILADLTPHQIGSVHIPIRVNCPTCASISFNYMHHEVPGLELPQLAGYISSPWPASWRIENEFGDVMDGPITTLENQFNLSRLPLFPGVNVVQVVVPKTGELLESSCARNVTSLITEEQGLRALLSWDGATSDLDLLVVDPDGTFGDPIHTLSVDTPQPWGTILDDFDGLGPETITIPSPHQGVYGVVARPISDGDDPGSTAVLRLLHDGRLLVKGSVGPRYLAVHRREIWIAGTLTITNEGVSWSTIDQVLPANAPPTTAPRQWPTFY